MRVWTWAKESATCGACPAVIGDGEMYLSIELDGVKRKKARCLLCAEVLYGAKPPAIVKAPPAPPPRPTPPVQNARMQGAARVASMRRLQRLVRQPKPACLPKARSIARAVTPDVDSRPVRTLRSGVLPHMYDAKLAAAGRED